jgi:hypothetical protein
VGYIEAVDLPKSTAFDVTATPSVFGLFETQRDIAHIEFKDCVKIIRHFNRVLPYPKCYNPFRVF